jgi:hypothetical protein
VTAKRRNWHVGSPRELQNHGYVTETSRERAFALAGVRSINSGKGQQVLDTDTGELWRVYFGWSSSEVKQLHAAVSS